MTDQFDDEPTTDIEDILRRASIARPSAAVEEELLLRMRDELTAGLPNVLPEADILLDPFARATATEQARSPWLTRIAAAAVVIAATASAAVIVRTSEAPVDTANPPTTSTPAAIDLDAAAATCERYLPEMGDMVVGGIEVNQLVDPDPIAPLYAITIEATQALRETLSPGPQTRTLIQELEDLLELAKQAQELEQAGRESNAQNVLPALARRFEAVAEQVADLGVPACRITQPDD